MIFYDLQLYAIVQYLKYWRHYSIQWDFILSSDHNSLRHIQSQKHLSAKLTSWVDFLQQFYFVLKHKVRAKNRVADALYRRVDLLNTLSVSTIGLKGLKPKYSYDAKLGLIYTTLTVGSNVDHPDYSLKDGFLFRHNQLCLPAISIQEFIYIYLASKNL